MKALRHVNAARRPSGFNAGDAASNIASSRLLSSASATCPRILVVDDDAGLREAIGALLEVMGYEVGYASDGRSALDQVAQRRPEAVVTDLQMPGMDGFELLREMAIQNSDVPVIAISGGDTALLETARKLGAAETFAKPVLGDTLASAIERCMPAARA
jgi:CheY-like chemotaxis protein